MDTGNHDSSGHWHLGIDLLRQVHSCDYCRNLAFSRPDVGKPFYKFPPSIGASDRADLLFVEIAPLLTRANEALHRRLVDDMRAFEELSWNRVDGERYIRMPGGEPYYRDHMLVVEGVFGRGASFEEHAAVTQLFLCATENVTDLPCDKSPCANAYFEMVFEQVRPQYVICVGEQVLRYFRRRFKARGRRNFKVHVGGHRAKVLSIAHPSSPGIGTLQRREMLRLVIGEIRQELIEAREPRLRRRSGARNQMVQLDS